MNSCQSRLRELVIHKSTNSTVITREFERLESCYRDASLDAWLRDDRLDAKSIAFVLFNCGKLAKNSRTSLRAPTVNTILRALIDRRRYLSAKEIGTAFTALGRLGAWQKPVD